MNSTLRCLAPALLVLAAASCASSGASKVTESYVQTQDGALLHYRKLGDGPQTVVVLGEALTSPDLDRLARGRTLIYYDLRHRGRSGKAERASLEQDLADLDAMLDWFRAEQVTLVGFDYQAALIALYAEQHPERVGGLVLISPIPARKFPYWNIYERLYNERVDADAFQRLREMKREGAQRLQPQAWSDAYRDLVLSGWVQDQASLRHMRARPMVEPNLDPEPLYTQYMRLIRSFGDWDWRSQLGRVQCPALVVSGSADATPAESLAEWAEVLPRGVASTIEGSGRMPWIERSPAFFQAVEDFLGK